MVLRLEAQVSLTHNDDLGERERGDLANAVYVSLDKSKLLRRLCMDKSQLAERVRAKTCIKKTMLPLQSVNVSTPMSCTSDKMSEQIPNVLEKAAHVLNRAWVEGVVSDSLARLEAEFFAEKACPQIARLRALLKSGSHVDLLAVFFLLLNIDHGLKSRVLGVDEGNAKRIARFLIDLRQELVVDFFCSGQSAGEFVRACNEAWCVS